MTGSLKQLTMEQDITTLLVLALKKERARTTKSKTQATNEAGRIVNRIYPARIVKEIKKRKQNVYANHK